MGRLKRDAGHLGTDDMSQVLHAPGIRVADVSWPEVETRLAAGASALLAIGAAAKEHGRHLPMATDYFQAEWLVRRVIHEFPVVVWPTFAYGYYPSFVEFPGSVSLPEPVFVEAVGAVFDSMRVAGARQAVLLNTGISTIPPLERTVAEAPLPVHLVNVYAGPRFAEALNGRSEQAFGGHADEVETSIMLAIAPHRVEPGAARPGGARIERGLFNRHDPEAPNYSPDGVNGDPTLASPEKGEAFVQALWGDVHAAVTAALGGRAR